jgi:AcrR family transcriptional regulator
MRHLVPPRAVLSVVWYHSVGSQQEGDVATVRQTRRRSTDAQSRREHILTTAAQLFSEKGFEATSIQDIAERVGMLKGSLYYHISSKDELLFEIIEDTHRVFARNLDIVAQLDGGPLEKIWAFVYRNVLGNSSNPVRSTIFFTELRSLGKKQRKQIIDLRDAHDEALRELVAAGQAAGVIRPSYDKKLVAIAVLTMCNALHTWYRPKGEWSPEFIGRGYADFVTASLSTSGSKSKPPVDGDAIIAALAPIEASFQD